MSGKISWWNVEFDDYEISDVAKAIREKHISQGQITERLENEISNILNIPYVVATTSGSVALLMALMALGIGKDDEVIIPNRTFIATAHAVVFTGATVVLADTLQDIPIIDVSKIEQKITSKTKAIIPVHLNGRSAEMDKLNEIADSYKLCVVEDAAQAFFSKNTKGYLGTQSDIGCFSLGMTKLVSTGQGGIVVTHHKDIFEKLKLIRNHGVSDTFHSSYDQFGYNFKYTDLQAAIGLVQLKKLPQKISNLIHIYKKYESGIADIQEIKLIPVNLSIGEVPIYVEILCSKRSKLIEFLKSHDIRARPFHPDLYLSHHLKNMDAFLKPSIFHEEGLFLPSGPNQALEIIDKVIDILHLF